jgi:hypothetical protein
VSLNTTPRTWAASEVATSTHLNTEVRDALTGIQAAWTTYVPTWAAITTNPAIGNGTLQGFYMRIGKTIHFRVVITMGSTTTYGTGQWYATLPVAPVSTLGRLQFNSSYYDSAIADRSGVATWDSANSRVLLHSWPTTAGAALAQVSATVPHTWGTSDQVVVGGTYEAA